jgi:ribose transport system permease protein
VADDAATAGLQRPDHQNYLGLSRRRLLAWADWLHLSDQVGLILVILALAAGTALYSDVFLTRENLTNVLRQVSVVGVLAAGLTLLMISGGIDFSVGALAALAAAVAAQAIVQLNSELLGVLAALGIGLGMGTLTGLVVALSGAPPFVVTLGTTSALAGLALVVIEGRTVSLGGRFNALGIGNVLGIPILVLVMLAVLVGVGLILRHTLLGRHAFAIGGNEEASLLSGIPVARTKVLLYALNGLLAGLAGLMLLSRVGAASPGSGLGLELQAIAAVAIGGTALQGGRGSLVGTVLGVLLLGLVTNALNLLQVATYYQTIAVGVVIVVAAVLNELRLRRR